jgi:hypothetical protein
MKQIYLKINGGRWVSGLYSDNTGFHFGRWSEVVFSNLFGIHAKKKQMITCI